MTTGPAPAFARFVRALRTRTALSLRDAAKQSGVHYFTLHRWEQGHAPSPARLRRFARWAGVPVHRLVELVENPDAPDERVDALVREALED